MTWDWTLLSWTIGEHLYIISNILSVSEDSGCWLFVYRIYEEFYVNLCECSIYGYCYISFFLPDGDFFSFFFFFLNWIFFPVFSLQIVQSGFFSPHQQNYRLDIKMKIYTRTVRKKSTKISPHWISMNVFSSPPQYQFVSVCICIDIYIIFLLV